jgi:hypothetical protein
MEDTANAANVAPVIQNPPYSVRNEKIPATIVLINAVYLKI